MYGCGNTHHFLQEDNSGYRRYVVINIDRMLDFEGLKAERWQLWAEALTLVGEIDVSQVDGATERAQEYVMESPLKHQIMEFINLREEKTFAYADFLKAVGREKETQNRSLQKDFANSMIALGYEKKNGLRFGGNPNGRTGWRPITCK